MPWTETNAMEQKEQFITEMLKYEKPFKHLCAEFGISEKTGHKWKNRFMQDGKTGLLDESRAPRAPPNSLPEDTVAAILGLKYAHEAWGPKKIQAIFARSHPAQDCPSVSSIQRILGKAQMVKRRKVRKNAECSERLRQPYFPNLPTMSGQ